MKITLSWRDTLKTLLPQFEALAARSPGLHHLFVEVSDDKRENLFGPNWIAQSLEKKVKFVNGHPVYEKWDCCKVHGLPLINPSFREPKTNETFDESIRVIRDGSGVVRAVPIPMRLRQAFYCGNGSDIATAYESLASAAATVLAGAGDLNEHFFASDLVDIFRKPRGGVRYVFGDVPTAPKQFLSSGWNAGVLQFEHGIVVDVPVSESAPNADNWVLLLHRLGWRRVEGSGLRAERKAWHDNIEVAWELLDGGAVHEFHGLSALYSQVSKDAFYSVIGTRETPLNVCLASVFAIQMLLADLAPTLNSESAAKHDATDYSREEWHLLRTPSLRGVSEAEAKSACAPAVGILVATEVERQAVLKRMRPPRNKRAVLQVHIGANTYYLGRLGAHHVVLCMSAMGSVGRDASTMVTTEMIATWEPCAVIMVGIAFGKDANRQEIGTVLVADKIISYESQRVGSIENQDRGNQPLAGKVLLNRCRNVCGWRFQRPGGQLCGFQVGPMLSGEKLIDNPDFKRDLFERFPNAIGGEMEGAGVASAADRKGCEWIVIKAICDWGDGTKSSNYQEFAAASSVHFVEHVLNQPGVLDSLLD